LKLAKLVDHAWATVDLLWFGKAKSLESFHGVLIAELTPEFLSEFHHISNGSRDKFNLLESSKKVKKA
jgi:hypothetical protein